MDAPFAKTRYRVAQHWRFRNDSPEWSDTLVIVGVEDHPTQGIICNVGVEYDPPFRMSPSTVINDAKFWVTQAAMDRSVLELVAEKGTLPRGYGTTGDFRYGPEVWERNVQIRVFDRTVGDLTHAQTERHKEQRDGLAGQSPSGSQTTPTEELILCSWSVRSDSTSQSQRPPAEALGFWSLIAYDEAGRFGELLRQHPTLASEPLPRDASDGYCYSDVEYDECYPLMLATELGSVEVAKVLLECGVDPKQRNARGEGALHFAGRSSSNSDEVAEIARWLCERGADPEGRNTDGKTPLTCGYCRREVAEILIEFGATPTLNHALRLGMLDWARRELRDNPDAVRNTVFPGEVLDDIGRLILGEAERRHGREFRVRRGETPSAGEDGWPDRMAYLDLRGLRMTDDRSYLDEKLAVWRRQAEIERSVFEEYRDLLDLALARGADPNHGTSLSSAVQMFDTSLAGWLLSHGADPNREIKGGTASYMPDHVRTLRMLNLLHWHGALDNPYTYATEPWEAGWKRLTDRLKELFD